MGDTEHQAVWMEAFSKEQRDEQQESDAAAWRGIIGILMVIVAMGASLAALTVWAITKFA